MTTSLVPYREFIPESQFPSLETLDALPMTESDIFPHVEPTDPLSPLGNYSYPADPSPASPLYPLLGEIKAIKAKALLGGGQPVPEEIKRVNRAAVLQNRLISSINKGYYNLIIDGFSPFEATYEIASYIEDQDQKKWEEYQDNVVYYQGLIEALRRGDRLFIPEYVIEEAFTNDEGEVDDPISISPELQREAYITFAKRGVDLNEARIERLDFEWLTSTVAVERLRESLIEGISPQKLAIQEAA